MLSIQALRLPTLSGSRWGGERSRLMLSENQLHCVSDIRAHYGFNFGKCPLTDTELLPLRNATEWMLCTEGTAVYPPSPYPPRAHFSC